MMCWPYARKSVQLQAQLYSTTSQGNWTGGAEAVTPAEVHSTVGLPVCEVDEFWFREMYTHVVACVHVFMFPPPRDAQV